MSAEALLQFVEDKGIDTVTQIGAVNTFIEFVRLHAPFLTSILVVTRGHIRPPDVRAQHLLADWAENIGTHWRAHGIEVRIVVEGQIHVRRCILQGVHEAAEVRLEWGILNHTGGT
eukprot:5770846-Prorocentrum_lima.AAC.1